MTPPDEFDPAIGAVEEIGVGLRRIVAPNASPMTYRGTNTYLLGTRQLAVIDPGPADQAHLSAILDALRPGQTVSHILVTHAHLDHSPLARALAEQTGAPVLAYGDAQAGRSEIMTQLAETGLAGGGEGVDGAFAPDECLKDGQEICADDWRLRAHWTPGHFGNHMSFEGDGFVLTGDLVMGWASSLVSPPDGDLTDFMRSCRHLKTLDARVLHSGHGAPITDPKGRLDWLIAHRTAREASIRAQLETGAKTAAVLTRRIYTETPAPLLPAAERNVLAHLIDLYKRGQAEPLGPLSATAEFTLS